MQTESWWQSQTFKALVLYVATMVANAVARKWGYSLNTEEIAGLTVTVVGFIMGRQYKQGKLLDNEIHPLQVASAENAKPATDIPSGLKSLVPLVLVCALAVPMTGCALFQRVGRAADLAAPKLLDCTIDAAGETFSAAVATAAGELGRYLDTGRYDVQPMIDEMLAKSTSSLIPCAIAEVLRAWQQAGSGAGVDLPQDRERARLMLLAAHVGQAHLLERGYVCR